VRSCFLDKRRYFLVDLLRILVYVFVLGRGLGFLVHTIDFVRALALGSAGVRAFALSSASARAFGLSRSVRFGNLL